MNTRNSFSIDRYWTPVSDDYSGSIGNAEAQYALASVLQVGDVGDPEWMHARRLPFGDEASENFYPGTRSFVFLKSPFECNDEAYEEDRNRVAGNPIKSILAADKTFTWAVQEAAKLRRENPETYKEDPRYIDLIGLVAEIRSYETRQIAQEIDTLFAPEWALDVLVYGQAEVFDPDKTRVIEEFAEPKVLAARVVSSTPYASYTDVYTMKHITENYELKNQKPGSDGKFSVFGFKVERGKKVYGELETSGKTSAIILQRNLGKNILPYNPKFRDIELTGLLQSCKLRIVNEVDSQYLEHEDINMENILEHKAIYSRLVDEVGLARQTYFAILSHIEELKADRVIDGIVKEMKKAGVYSKFKEGLVPHKSDSVENDIRTLIDTHMGKDCRVHCLAEVPRKLWDELFVLLGQPGLYELVTDKLTKNWYILSTKGKVVGYTQSKDEANAFKNGMKDQLLWHLLSPKDRVTFYSAEEMFQQPSVVNSIVPTESSDYLGWKTAVTRKVLGQMKRKAPDKSWAVLAAELTDLTESYCEHRSVKFVPSQITRDVQWLLEELPFTASQFVTLGNVIEAYGRAIVTCQMQLPAVRLVFARTQNVIRSLLEEGALPDFAINEIAETGSLGFLYEAKMVNVPSGYYDKKQLQDLGLLSASEIKGGKYLHIDIIFDRELSVASDIFRYVGNYKVEPRTVDFCKNLLAQGLV